MNYLYKLVTTKNVEINYDALKKKELIECLVTMRDIYFSLKQENQKLKDRDLIIAAELTKLQDENKQLKDNWIKLKEWVNKQYDYYMNEKDYIGGRLCFGDMKNNMQELEQGSE